MDEALFKNTRKHEDLFKTGDISTEFRKDTDRLEVRHKTLEALDSKVKFRDDMVINTMKKDQKVALAHGVDYQLERPKHKAHIGFSRLYTEIEAGDSEYMKQVRTTLGRFYDYKELAKDSSLTADRKQWLIEAQMNALSNLLSACDNYASHRKIRLFKTARKRRAEVSRLREKALQELDSMKTKYVSFMEKKVSEDGYASDETAKSVIKLKSLKQMKGKKKELDLSSLDLMEKSDRESYSQKHYLAIRSELDLKKDNLTPKETSLLKKINEYAKIRSGAGLIEYCRKQSGSKQKKARKAYRREIELLGEINAAYLDLNRTGELTEDKKKLFSHYMDDLSMLVNGGLVLDEKKMNNYNTLDLTGDDVEYFYHCETNGHVKKKSLNTKNRSDEPLFAHEPCMSDVVQDSMGNCFLLAAIAELVAKDSRAVMNMMHDDGETVTVRLYAQKGFGRDKRMEPFYVKIDKRVDAQTATDTLWVQLLCKAYAAFVREHHVVPEEDFKRRYGAVDDAVRMADHTPDKYIEYGFIDGGTTNDVLPVLTGELYKEKQEVLGSADEVETDIDVIKIMHESKYTDSQQEKLINSGKIFDLDIAYMEETKTVAGDALKEPIKMVYIKSAFSEMEKKQEERLAAMNKEIGSITVKENRIKQDKEEEKLARVTEYTVRSYFSKRFGDYNSKLQWEDVEGYYAGSKAIDKEDLELIKSIAEEINKNSFVIVEKKDSAGKLLKQMPEKELAEYINEILTIKCKSKFYRQANSEMFYGRMDRYEALDISTEEGLKKEKLGMKKACLRMVSKCIEVIERRHFSTQDDIVAAEEDKVKKYRLMAQKVDGLSVAVVREISSGIDNEFVTLAQLLDCTYDEALTYIKGVMKAKYRIFDEKQEEVSGGKTAQLFSGAYSSSTLRLYESIKKEIGSGKTLSAGSREGWGKKTSRGETKDKGTVGKHAYSILGVQDVNFRGKKIHMLKLRNPWGSYTLQYFWNEKKKEMEFDTKETDSSGVFYMELTHFSRVFANIYTTGEKKVAE